MPRRPRGKEAAVTKSVRLEQKTAEAIETLGGGDFSRGARMLLLRGLRLLRMRGRRLKHPRRERHARLL